MRGSILDNDYTDLYHYLDASVYFLFVLLSLVST